MTEVKFKPIDEIKPLTETEALFQLGKPTLHALSYSLRHPDTWPENFVWDYSDCNDCAMGLASCLWNLKIEEYDEFGDDSFRRVANANKSMMARTFAMPFSDAERIFYNANFRRVFNLFPIKKESVTPDMVADMIDAYLAKVK